MSVGRYGAWTCAAAIALFGSVGFQGVASAQELEMAWSDAGEPLNNETGALIAGIWGGATTLEPVSRADCFNVAADVGGGRVSERTDVYGRAGGKRWIAFEQDCGIRNRGRINKPLYRPEYWDQVKLADYNANVGGEWLAYADPEWQNIWRGVPRAGAPDKIIFNDDPIQGRELVFLYQRGNTFKIMEANCQQHDEVLAFDQLILGHAVACWEDGSLIVHSRGFSDRTWLHWAGWFHSNEMEVIERFTPNEDGSEMLYEVTVIDPVMFLEPWEMDKTVLQRNTNPEAVLLEDVPYIEHSLGVMALPRNRG